MLGYILGITKWGNNGITNRDKLYWLQIGTRGITDRDSLRDFKLGQKDYKSGQRDSKSGQRSQIGAREITNQGRDFKSGQRLQIGAEHCMTTITITILQKHWNKLLIKLSIKIFL